MPRKRRKNQQASCLCSLPAEIRLKILEELVVAKDPIEVTGTSPRPGASLDILRTCQLMYNEGIDLFHAKSSIQITYLVGSGWLSDPSRCGISTSCGYNPAFDSLMWRLKYTKVHKFKLCLTTYRACDHVLHMAKHSVAGYRNQLEDPIRMIAKETIFEDAEITFAFCSCLRDKIAQRNTKEGKSLAGVFELLRCKKFDIAEAPRQDIRIICERVESGKDVVDLGPKAVKYAREIADAQASAGKEWYTERASTSTALREILKAARQVNIPEYLKQKKILDTRMMELRTIAKEKSERDEELLRILYDQSGPAWWKEL